MDINVVRVEGETNTVVDNLVEQLRNLDPGVYSVGKDSATEVNKIKAALGDHGYRTRSRKIGVGGTRLATKGKHVGEMVDVIHYELLVTVSAPAGEGEPPLPPKAPRTPKPNTENAPVVDTDDDLDADTVAEVENNERKHNR